MKKLIKKFIREVVFKKYFDFQKKKQLKLYQGDKVVCPICNSRFSEFAPYVAKSKQKWNACGMLPRKNAVCPTCGAMERHRLLWLYLNEKTDLFNSKEKIKLLHFAPEKIFYNLFARNSNIEYVPCDLFPEEYNYGGKIKVEKINITNIPFAGNYFDVILCNHVLEHIPDDKFAMSELYRVMKKGGWAILQVPIDYNNEKTYEDFSITSPEGREKAFGQNDHVRWYGRDYIDRLKQVGFNVTEDDFVKSFSSEDLLKYGLIESELIYLSSKN